MEEEIKKTDSSTNQEWTWLTKLKLIVDLNYQPLRSADILDYLIKHDLRAKFCHNKPRCLSVHINKAVKYEWFITNRLKDFIIAFLNG